MKTKKWRAWIPALGWLLFLVVVLAIWFFTPAWVEFLWGGEGGAAHLRVCGLPAGTESGPNASALTCVSASDSAARLGALGDRFGTLNALFSGLALTGVAISLGWQTLERRRAEKPFVIPRVDVDCRPTSEIRESRTVEGKVEFPFSFELPFRNASDVPAVDVIAEFVLNVAGTQRNETRPLALPIPGQDNDTLTLELPLQGDDAARLRDALKAQSLSLSVEIAYDNLDGLRWRSEVRYALSAREGELDQAVQWLDEALSGQANDGGLGGRDRIHLEPTAVQGSWRHEQA